MPWPAFGFILRLFKINFYKKSFYKVSKDFLYVSPKTGSRSTKLIKGFWGVIDAIGHVFLKTCWRHLKYTHWNYKPFDLPECCLFSQPLQLYPWRWFKLLEWILIISEAGILCKISKIKLLLEIHYW